ncbi:MAG: hypothetical protein JJU16_05140 [Alkalibacterium sp.]|nr:hypothetical protein [Alkalibacterium sp.]
MRTKGKHLKDFGLKLVWRDAPPPEQKEIKEPLFGVQGDLDFSLMLGEPVFNNRVIRYGVKTYVEDPEWFRLLKTRVENWLIDGRIDEIEDDYEGSYYYKGKCLSVELGDDSAKGEASYVLTFECYPFKKAELYEGNDVWDEFNFYLDYSQDIEFDVNGSQEITLMNIGSTSVVPRIVADSNFSVTKDNQVLNVTPGENKNDDFRLMKGENKLTITGTGNIKFEYYKELI